MSSEKEKPDVCVQFYHRFLSEAETIDWLKRSRQIEWTKDEIRMNGKKIPMPRKESLFEDDFKNVQINYLDRPFFYYL